MANRTSKGTGVGTRCSMFDSRCSTVSRRSAARHGVTEGEAGSAEPDPPPARSEPQISQMDADPPAHSFNAKMQMRTPPGESKTARLSVGKPKGSGNAKNGNPYLSWAFSEAAHFTIRHHDVAKRYY